MSKRASSPSADSSSATSSKKAKAAPSPSSCVFGTKCYRRNPHHFREYSHEHLLRLFNKFRGKTPPDSALVSFEAGPAVVKEQYNVFVAVCKPELPKKSGNHSSEASPRKSGSVHDKATSSTNHAPSKFSAAPKSAEQSLIQRKLSAAAPFNLFLTKIKDSPSTHTDLDSIYIAELLHPSLGKLKKSLQINFMVEWDWLKMNYEISKNEDKPLLIIHGEENPDLHASNLPDHVRAVRVKPKYPFGTHHTKMMILQYDDDSVRVVVHTANLVGSDWENRTQGLWVSPRCSQMAENSSVTDGESPSGFKASLLRYVKFYELTLLRPFIETLKRCDFSKVNVCFISSVPNSHRGPDLNSFGHRALAATLRKGIVTPGIDSWPLIAQCSSIGSLGANEFAWFKGEFGQSLASTNKMASGGMPPINMVYPSKQNVMGSYDGILGGGCLPYSARTHEKQPWLEKFLTSWHSKSRNRERAMPHIKTYTRISPDCTKAAYFHLTSANLSKAAWGSMNKAKENLMIMSYEAGVLFLPKFVTPGKDCFELGKDFRLPYDVPLEQYKHSETPWFMDILRSTL